MMPQAPILVDTGYVLAQVNHRDQWHGPAARWRQYLSAVRHRLIVTEYVLVEIANGLSGRRYRQLAATIIAGFRNSADVEFVSASAELLDAALTLY
jgi:predicted nucleic acid-binding protein